MMESLRVKDCLCWSGIVAPVVHVEVGPPEGVSCAINFDVPNKEVNLIDLLSGGPVPTVLVPLVLEFDTPGVKGVGVGLPT